MPEPVEETGAGAGQTTQILFDLLALMAARLTSIEEHLTITWDEFIWRFDQQFISSAA